MAEMEDPRQAPAAETAERAQASVVQDRSEASRVLAGAVVVLMLLVPAAFVTGWRLGRTIGRLRGY
jgi:hypothetical protein